MEDQNLDAAMKERYVAEAKLQQRQANEHSGIFGQAFEDLHRRAYPDKPNIVEEYAIKPCLDKCGESNRFHFKRTQPRTLQEAITIAMQENCFRMGERMIE